jgi:transcriptional regulator with XRE-family HTH domain
MMMTSAQCKMARAALGWSARELAREAQVGSATVDRFETGRGKPIPSTVAAMQRAMEAAGIEFIPGGAKLREAADAEL